VATATLEQCRALIATIFSTFWLEKPMGIKAITPTGLYLPLVGVIMLGADGVADGTLFPHPHITRRPVALHHPRPLHGVGRAQAA
jgi:hypothetical protein